MQLRGWKIYQTTKAAWNKIKQTDKIEDFKMETLIEPF
jgi:hypothetical protein